MPQVEALYVVQFGDTGSRAIWNGGVIVLETNRIFGGDSGYYYIGSYTTEYGRFNATVKIVKHDPGWTNAFGDAAESFTVTFQGTMNNGIMQGMMERIDRPGIRLPVRLTWKEDLP